MIPDADTIARRLNEAFEDLFVRNPEGQRMTIVCAVCDELLSPTNKSILPLHWFLDARKADTLAPSWQNLPQALRACYEVDLSNILDDCDPNNRPDLLRAVKSSLLSPRSTYVRNSFSSRRSGLT